MSCEEMRSLMNDYLDDELSPESRGRLRVHLRDCGGCRAELEELSALLDSASRLERDVAPRRDLWSGIEQRIMPPRAEGVRGSRWSAPWVGWAAAAVLVAAVAIQVTRQEATPPALAPLEGASTEHDSRIALVSDAARARDGLLQVRVDLLRSITELRNSLDSEAREAVDENLRVIDRAITDLCDALQEDPDNHRLELLLAATYQLEVRFLKQMHLL